MISMLSNPQILASCKMPHMSRLSLAPFVITEYMVIVALIVKGQMHHHYDLGSKCAYKCHLSNETTF